MTPDGKRILAFFRGEKAGPHRLRDILEWDHEKMEQIHDYIQWLFPLPTPSSCIADAPILDHETALHIMVDAESSSGVYEGARKWTAYLAKTDHWCSPGNHNLLRVSRSIESLILLGRVKQATVIHHLAIARYDASPPHPALTESRRFWLRARQARWLSSDII